ncbi:hypothetical protein RJT34_30456 [Clitoria ternatea]|uniref:Uncharacterized protein n=1 Tax=Clitoria ternatea TaxID=43366 RepID=A0AAN9EX11_CLITE
MTGKKSNNFNKVNFSHSEDDYEVQDPEKELDLPLEKLNLGPRKKLLVYEPAQSKSWIKINVQILGLDRWRKKYKPLFFKELNKVWDDVNKGGPHSVSNTLLIDDKSYKAFFNPIQRVISNMFAIDLRNGLGIRRCVLQNLH